MTRSNDAQKSLWVRQTIAAQTILPHCRAFRHFQFWRAAENRAAAPSASINMARSSLGDEITGDERFAKAAFAALA